MLGVLRDKEKVSRSFRQLPLEAMKIVTLFALSAAVKFRVHPTADDEWLRPYAAYADAFVVFFYFNGTLLQGAWDWVTHGESFPGAPATRRGEGGPEGRRAAWRTSAKGLRESILQYFAHWITVQICASNILSWFSISLSGSLPHHL